MHRRLTEVDRMSIRPFNFLCIHGIFCQLLLTFHASICQFPSVSWTFLQLPSTFHASAGHSVNFYQFSEHPRYLLSGSVYSLLIRGTMRPLSVCPWDLPSNFRTSVGPSVNFHPLFMHRRELPSTCINFSCISGTFSQLSVHPWDFPSTSIKSQCIRETMRQIFVHQFISSVIFSTHSVQTRDLPSTASTFRASVGHSVNFLFVRGTFCQLSLCLRDLSTLFNFPLLLGSSGSSIEFPTPNS